MLMKKVAKERDVAVGTVLTRERRLAEAKREIGEAAETEQLGVGPALRRVDQPLCLEGIEIKFDGRSGNVPGDVLTADQIVPL